MAQLEVFANPDKGSRRKIPYLLDVQHDLLDGLTTRVVVPLAKLDVMAGHALDRLTPTVEVDGQELVMLTPELAGVPKTALGKRVGELQRYRAEIIGAVDMLLTGV